VDTNEIEVSVMASVRPTESTEKVARAIENLFFGLDLTIGESVVEGRGGIDSLRTFHRLLREQKILDTARSVLLRGKIGDDIQFRLGKQAATVSRINFPPEEEMLGSIHVNINGPDLLVDWLAPTTAEGKPIEEIELELEDHV